MLDGVDLFARHCVLHERAGGFPRLRVMRLADGEIRDVDVPESAYFGARRGECRVRHRRVPLRLRVAGDPRLGVRLRHEHARAHAAQAAAGAGGLRSRAIRFRGHLRHRPGRRAGAGFAGLPPRQARRRSAADAAHRLRRLRLPLRRPLQLGAPVAARSRRDRGHRPHPRRRRDGQALARRGPHAGEEEQLHRLHRGGRAPDRLRLHGARRSW